MGKKTCGARVKTRRGEIHKSKRSAIESHANRPRGRRAPRQLESMMTLRERSDGEESIKETGASDIKAIDGEVKRVIIRHVT